MRPGWTTILSSMAAAAVLTAACSTGTSSQVGDPPAIGGPDIEASDAGDPWAVPDVITEDYIRRVLTEIEREDAMFWRWLLASEPGEQPPDEIAAHIHRAYIAVSSQQVIDQLLQQYAEDEGRFEGALRPYGQYLPDEIVIHRADPQCPLIEVSWDASTVEVNGTRAREVVALLRPSDQGVNASGFVYATIFEQEVVTQEDIDQELAGRSLCV